jgi:hypothetical protein
MLLSCSLFLDGLESESLNFYSLLFLFKDASPFVLARNEFDLLLDVFIIDF